jgi:phosphoribosylglycinamide formyltransferase-1
VARSDKIAVFASGGGSNFQALLDKQDAGLLHARFAVLICNNSGAKAMDRARARAIPTVHLPPSRFSDERSYSSELRAVLSGHEVDYIALAGYMKQIPAEVVNEYQNRIINIHPGLLPAFGGKGMYGKLVHQAVLDYGAKISGITVHFVDAEYDHGPVILQEIVPVLDTDTADVLAERVLKVEHANYWRAVEALVQGTIRVEGRKVRGTV